MQIIFVIFILIMKVSNLHVPFDVSNLGPSLHLHSQVEDGVLDLDRNLHVLPIYEKSKKAWKIEVNIITYRCILMFITTDYSSVSFATKEVQN